MLTLIFLAARWGFGERLSARIEAGEGTIKRIKQGINENQWSMLFLIRLVPAVPFFVANLLPAFLNVPLRRFVISTFLGIIPGGVVYTSVGAGLGEVFERGESPKPGRDLRTAHPVADPRAVRFGAVARDPQGGAREGVVMERIKTDILVIGGGSGGLSVASGAAQMGADVVLLEGHKMGGDCLNYGCVPSKALLAMGKRAHAGTGTSHAEALDHVRKVIATIEPHDSVERFEGLGVRVISDYGHFVSPTEVEVGGARITGAADRDRHRLFAAGATDSRAGQGAV